MLTLVEPVIVEPVIVDKLADRPHLGCAMLIAACQEKGIKTKLLKGQTRYLKDMFVSDSEELWTLIEDLKEKDLKRLRLTGYKRSIREKGIKQFQDELKRLYQYLIADKNPRHYFDIKTVEKLRNLYRIFIDLYSYYIGVLNYPNLKIIDRYLSEIIKTNPDYIGFSLQGDFGPLSRIIRKRIKELTGIPIIVGGALTPFIDLKELDKTFEEECLDYLVIGAGELALPSLIEALEDKREPKGIANVFYRKDGKVKGNDLEVIDDLDSLPYPDYSQFDLDLYLTPKKILPLQTARGCSWSRCAFCSFHRINLKEHRAFGIDKIIQTLSHLKDTYRCEFFSFDQEELPPGQAERISMAILSSNLKDINIYTTVRLEDRYNNSALLGLMRKAGFVQLHWGVESGSQRVLDLMNKGTNIRTMSEILKKSFESGIGNICFIFFGFPGETKKEARQTIEFLRRNAGYINDISCAFFVLSRYSPVGEDPERWGLKIKADGNYLSKSGISSKEANAFCSKFIGEYFLLNDIKVTSGKMNHLLRGEMTNLLILGHNLLSATVLLKRLKERKLSTIFPIIFGETRKRNEKTVFYPVNIRETAFINQHHPEKEKVLDSLEERAFALSCGRLSIEGIISEAHQAFGGEYEKDHIREESLEFFRTVFSKHWGLGFERPWS